MMIQYIAPRYLSVGIILILFLLEGCSIGTIETTPVRTPPVASPRAPLVSPTPLSFPSPSSRPTSQAQQQPRPSPQPSPIPTSTPTPTPIPFPDKAYLELFVEIPGQITYLTHAGDGSEALFVTERSGRVWRIPKDTQTPDLFLDIQDRVDSSATERGLLSIAFDPHFAENGLFYVNYISKQGRGDTVIARFRTTDFHQADPASETEILRIDQPKANHNGGQLQFGPDGYLYIGMGDGGGAGDPWDNAENLQTLLGKLLRIQVSGEATYAIPPDNPFVGREDARMEIWAYGLRNPWRFSFDRATGDLYIADVGQNAWEEIDFQSAGSPGGQHYGWDTMEGNHCFEPPEGCDRSGKVPPIWEYDHSMGCSVTGGYVYRGTAAPSAQGLYFFGDFCSGEIYALRPMGANTWEAQLVLETDLRIASFGEDEKGELYVLDLEGNVYRLLFRK